MSSSVAEGGSAASEDNADGVIPVNIVVCSQRERASVRNRTGDPGNSLPRDPGYVVGLVRPHQPEQWGKGEDAQIIRNSHADACDDERCLLADDEAETDEIPSCQLSNTCLDDVGITWQKATFLIVNAALGAGLLNFPRAFDEAGGIITGNVVHIVFTICALGSLLIIARCASERNCKTYQELILQMCSPGWGMLTSVFISTYCFITCITFIIIIGDQFDRVFASYIGSNFCHQWYFNRKFTMTVSSLLLIFPSCLKRIDGLRFLSYVGVVSIFYLMAVIVEEFYTGHYAKGPVVIFSMQWTQVFNVLPTICFGYQCHVSSIPIYSCLKKKDGPTFAKACVTAIMVCLTIYTISANYGYITFGSLVNGDVLLSYDATKFQVLLAVLLLAIKSWTTYPILMFCVREAVADIYIQMKSLSPVEAALNEPTRRKTIAVVLWIASILMAVFTPNIDIVVKLLGSLAAFFIFVFPGLCLLQFILLGLDMTGSTATWRDIVMGCVAVFYVLVGIFAFGLAFVLGVENIIDLDASQPLCT